MTEQEKVFKNLAKYQKAPKGPFTGFRLNIHLTWDCNFRCKYCYEKKQKKVVDINGLKNIVDKLNNYNEYKDSYWNGYLVDTNLPILVTYIDFFGGECLLEIDTMNEFMNYLDSEYKRIYGETSKEYTSWRNDLLILIETNGYLLRTKKSREFIRKWKKNVIVGTSFDGTKYTHDMNRVLKGSGKGTFDIVKKNILDTISEFKDVEVAVRGTITPIVVKDLYNSFLEFESLNLGYVNMPIVIGQSWTDEEIIELKKQLRLITNHLLNGSTTTHFSQYENNADITGLAKTGEYDGRYLVDATLRGFRCSSSCFLLGSGLGIGADNKIYTCYQFADITFVDDNGNKFADYSIGDTINGITGDYKKILDELYNSYDMSRYEDDNCKGCTTVSRCEYCPIFSYMYSKSFSKKNTTESCKVIKAISTEALYYKIKSEEKQWEIERDLL